MLATQPSWTTTAAGAASTIPALTCFGPGKLDSTCCYSLDVYYSDMVNMVSSFVASLRARKILFYNEVGVADVPCLAYRVLQEAGGPSALPIRSVRVERLYTISAAGSNFSLKSITSIKTRDRCITQLAKISIDP